MSFFTMLVIGLLIGVGVGWFSRASRKTSAFGEEARLAAQRERVRQRKANAPPFRDFVLQADARSYRGQVSWLGQDLPLEVTTYQDDDLVALNAAFDEFLAHAATLDREARERIAAEVMNTDTWLARQLDRPAPDFLAGLVLERLALDDYQSFDIVFRSELLGGIRVTVEGELGNEERTLFVRGIGLKPGVMPLELAGESYAIEWARFAMHVSTEGWSDSERRWVYGPDHVAANYSLEIVVDEHSGEDAAPSPMAQSIPVHRAAGGRALAPAALAGLEVDDQGDWDAWYGNDSPQLRRNRLRFGAVNGNRLSLRWVAEYQWSALEPPQSFVFEGEVELPVITTRVKHEADADAFMASVFGADYLLSLEKETGEWQEHDKSMPADRRRWLPVTYRPKRE